MLDELPILGFQGEYRWLSNFWPCKIHAFGFEYSCVENAYVASKSDDPDIHQQLISMTPGQAKRFGRKIEIIKNFDEDKVWIMKNLSKQKYSPSNLELVELLNATEERYIEETNTWGDVFWGVCKGKGENILGNILMNIRHANRQYLINNQWPPTQIL